MARTPDEPIATAALSLVALAACIIPFFPPFLEHTEASVLLMVFLGLCIAVTLALHLVFFAFAARRAHRPAALWIFLSVVFFPVGSIVGLIMFDRFGDERTAASIAKSS